ncbi:MAG: phosphoenolpyruvate--protein phosphotransferase [Deltaproteobacteria bacterium]|jgi:phosphotransferase system enzyme I (PtsI)|nr:phosphoenolpyruvate--protein phosphotransferase [Deltaproteobacteria bacterium]
MLKGVPVSPGTGIGRAFIYRDVSLDYSYRIFSGKEKELERLHEAIKAFKTEWQKRAANLETKMGRKESAIVLGQLILLDDPFLNQEMKKAIDLGQVAEAAVSAATGHVAQMYLSMSDEMMQARAQDMYCIREELIKLLLYGKTISLSELPPGTVFVTEELTHFICANFPVGNIEAILTVTGGKTSHSAILARALGIPAIMGIEDLLLNVTDDALVLVDGTSGEFYVNPDEDILEEGRQKKNEWRENQEALLVYMTRPSMDKDGKSYLVQCNISSLGEAYLAKKYGSDGVGLFRTEMLFMDRQIPPSEEEQLNTYLKVADIMGEKGLVIRTMDIGGDKKVPYLNRQQEPNPFLGFRGIRQSLADPALFGMQIRAVLRAGVQGKNIKIMLPLVTGVDELLEAKSFIEKEKESLEEKGIPFNPHLPVGIMVETPAAVQLASVLAKEADFFSIGTNDLTQYILAADRLNPRMDYLYSHFHPAVLKSIEMVILAAKSQGIPVGICGEAAASPGFIPIYISFGLDEWSVNPAEVPFVRRELSLWDIKDANEVTKKALEFSTTSELSSFLQKEVRSKAFLRSASSLSPR